MSQIDYGEMAADAWNSAMEPEVIAILLCSKCKMHSVYSWEIKNEEEWKQKHFCPHCQSRFFSKIDRGSKLTKSKWGLSEAARDENDSEKWKVAERLMGTATLLKKEELIDKILIQHVQSLNANVVKQIQKTTPSFDIQISDIERYENDLLLKHLMNKTTMSASANKYSARSR